MDLNSEAYEDLKENEEENELLKSDDESTWQEEWLDFDDDLAESSENVAIIIDENQEETQSKENSEPPSKKRKKRQVWKLEETIMVEMKVFSMVDNPCLKMSDVCLNISNEFSKYGYTRTPEQIKKKLRTLKRDYRNTKVELAKTGRGTEAKKTCPYYEELKALFESRPIRTQPGIDSIDPSKLKTNSQEADKQNKKVNENKQAPLKKILCESVDNLIKSEERIMKDILEQDNKSRKENSEEFKKILYDNTKMFLDGFSTMLTPLINSLTQSSVQIPTMQVSPPPVAQFIVPSNTMPANINLNEFQHSAMDPNYFNSATNTFISMHPNSTIMQPSRSAQGPSMQTNFNKSLSDGKNVKKRGRRARN